MFRFFSYQELQVSQDFLKPSKVKQRSLKLVKIVESVQYAACQVPYSLGKETV